jgi:hypothetical protein
MLVSSMGTPPVIGAGASGYEALAPDAITRMYELDLIRADVIAARRIQ